MHGFLIGRHWLVRPGEDSLDLEKAFDTVLHSSVMAGLRKSGVDEAALQSIEALYSDQQAYMQLDKAFQGEMQG